MNGLQSFLSMRRMDERWWKARVLWSRFSQSLTSRRHTDRANQWYADDPAHGLDHEVLRGPTDVTVRRLAALMTAAAQGPRSRSRLRIAHPRQRGARSSVTRRAAHRRRPAFAAKVTGVRLPAVSIVGRGDAKAVEHPAAGGRAVRRQELRLRRRCSVAIDDIVSGVRWVAGDRETHRDGDSSSLPHGPLLVIGSLQRAVVSTCDEKVTRGPVRIIPTSQRQTAWKVTGVTLRRVAAVSCRTCRATGSAISDTISSSGSRTM